MSEDYRQYRKTIRTAWGAAAVVAGVSAVAGWGIVNQAWNQQWRRSPAANGDQRAAESPSENLRPRSRSSWPSWRVKSALKADTGTAVLLAIEALPDAANTNKRPYIVPRQNLS